MRLATVKSSTLNEGGAQPQAKADFDRHVQNSKAAKDDQSQANNTVTAKTGDTLWDIAQDNGLSMKSLYQANPQFDPKREDGILHFDRSRRGGWDPDYIRPGDVIRIPTQAPSVPIPSVPTPSVPTSPSGGSQTPPNGPAGPSSPGTPPTPSAGH